MINVVLYQPEIPPNTGNIARLCVCNDFLLHLIHPLGFSLEKKQLLRAGLDYWPFLKVFEYKNWPDFWDKLTDEDRERVYFFSSRSKRKYWEPEYTENCYLVFGSETKGLPQELFKTWPGKFVTIPMLGKNQRCLNLSNAVSIASYEVLRQLEINGNQPK